MGIDISDAIEELKKVRINLPAKQQLPTDELVDEHERLLGFSFPDDYRVFLKEASDSVFNGKDALRVVDDRSHPRGLIPHAQEAWIMGVPKEYLPICEDNGNYYCISRDGKVIYWSHDGICSESWSSLAEWIKSVWIEGR